MDTNMAEAKSKSLVLVVGAGASKEVGLPTGEELKKFIAQALNFRGGRFQDVEGGDERIAGAIQKLAQSPEGRRGDINPYLRAAWLIRDAMPQAQSIDNFIDSHRSDEHIAACGKLAIASCILKAEGKSTIRVDRSNVYNKLKFSDATATWFNAFFQLLSESCQRNGLRARLREVTIVCFNYDRCIQHFLYESLKNYYSLKSEEAAELLAELKTYHPYGNVGALPWSTAATGIDYGSSQVRASELLDLSKRLRTFTEGTDETASDVIAIRSAMRSARRTVFLGFAFHPLNMQLLYGDVETQVSSRSDHAFATGLGLSESNADHVVSELCMKAGFRRENVVLRRDLTALQLIRDYSISVSVRS